MSPLLWDPDPKPPEDDDGKGELYFTIIALVLAAVVVIGQLAR